jgi:hypothetical protein
MNYFPEEKPLNCRVGHQYPKGQYQAAQPIHDPRPYIIALRDVYEECQRPDRRNAVLAACAQGQPPNKVIEALEARKILLRDGFYNFPDLNTKEIAEAYPLSRLLGMDEEK